MGIFDHRRTWQFQTSAAPDECVDVFVDSLTRGGFQLLASRWKVSQSVAPDGGIDAVARYAGRGGAIGAFTSVSERSANEQNAAIGSTLAFRVVRTADGRTRATMAMTETAQAYLFFVADARFFRSAMNRVARGMRDLDPSLVLVKE